MVLGLLLSGNAYADIWTVRSKHIDGQYFYIAQSLSQESTIQEALEKCKFDDLAAQKNPDGCLIMEVEFKGNINYVWNEEYKKYLINIANKIDDENNKERCEEIGFKPQTDNFAKCVLKLIEIAEIRKSALIESNSKASLQEEIQKQQIKIQDQIAKEAKASRDQQAWGVLLGMTMGSGILDSSSGGLFSSSTVSCNKTGETTSGTNKICYYNCMGSTKTINVGSMQFCPININK